MPKLFANIKWIEEEDDEKVTVGVPTDYIINFSYHEFLSEHFDPGESYVIKWQGPGRKPAGGHPKLDGLIPDVTATVQALERKSINYVYPKSPRVVTPRTESATYSPVDSGIQASGSGGGKRVSKTPITHNKSKNPKRNWVICLTSDHSDEEQELSKRTPLSALNQEVLKKTTKTAGSSKTPNANSVDREADDCTKLPDIPGDNDVGNNQKVNAEDPNETERDNFQNPMEQIIHHRRAESPLPDAPDGGKNQPLNAGNPPNLPHLKARRELQNLNVARHNEIDGQEFLELRDLLRENVRNQRQAGQNEEPDSVQLGPRQRGVMLPMLQWDAAKEQKTFTTMAICLVMSLLDHETLFNSNVEGGKSKIHKPADNAPRRPPLDPNIINATAVSVKKEIPRQFNITDMHTASMSSYVD